MRAARLAGLRQIIPAMAFALSTSLAMNIGGAEEDHLASTTIF
jgi:hypothetical protein